MSNNNVCDCQNKKKSYPTWSSNSELPHSNGPFITMSKAYFCYECSTLNIYNLHIEFDTHIYIYIVRRKLSSGIAIAMPLNPNPTLNYLYNSYMY